MDESDISGYLSSLRREGNYESSGAFSLSSQKSLEKLKEFQLQEKAEYILHLVSCAVHRGASQIQFDIRAHDVRMAFDGEPFSHAELDDVFGSFFATDTSAAGRSRKDLAIALNTITTFNPDFVVVESWQGQQGAVMQLYENQVWLETLVDSQIRPGRGSFQYVCFQTPLSFINYCMPTLTLWARAELELLRTRCCFGPARVWLNGVEIQKTLEGKTFLLTGEGVAPAFLPIYSKSSSLDAGMWGVVSFSDDSGASECLLRYVVGGVSYTETVRGFPEQTQIVVFADQLKKDLSQRALVRNADLEALQASLLKAVGTAADLIESTEKYRFYDLRKWNSTRPRVAEEAKI